MHMRSQSFLHTNLDTELYNKCIHLFTHEGICGIKGCNKTRIPTDG